MGATIKRANIILGSQWGGDITNLVVPTLYLSLSASAINKDGSGIKEPIIGTGGYARLAVANSTGSGGNFITPSNGKVSNAKELAFDKFTGNIVITGLTGQLYATHWFISNSPTSLLPSDVEWYGELKAQRPLVPDSIILFGVGDLVLEVEMPST